VNCPAWLEEIQRDFNHPAIVGWCPFNETWDNGQTGARQDDGVLRTTYLATKALDPTRPVIDTSGNFHLGLPGDKSGHVGAGGDRAVNRLLGK